MRRNCGGESETEKDRDELRWDVWSIILSEPTCLGPTCCDCLDYIFNNIFPPTYPPTQPNKPWPLIACSCSIQPGPATWFSVYILDTKPTWQRRARNRYTRGVIWWMMWMAYVLSFEWAIDVHYVLPNKN